MISSNPPLPIPAGDRARKIRVLIVDDSPVIGQIITAMLEEAEDIEIVGRAMDGQEAVRVASRLHPDVITMDIRMPKMDGLEATRRIMSLCPTPIIVVSSAVYAEDYRIAFNAIEAGALTVIEKPKGLGAKDFDTVSQELVTAVRTMSGVKVVGRRSTQSLKDGVGPMTAMLQDHFYHPVRVIAIAASTGGPPVLMKLFSSLPQDFSIPIVVVQHILPQFVGCMADWLGSRSTLELITASEGAQLIPGKIYLAPGGCHMTVNSAALIHLEYSEPIKGQRPSATRMFESVAAAFGSNAVGVILTGMGEDGVDGLEAMSKAGAHVIAQSESSSVVFGMPGVAVQRRIVDEVLPPEEILIRLMKLHKHSSRLQKGTL